MVLFRFVCFWLLSVLSNIFSEKRELPEISMEVVKTDIHKMYLLNSLTVNFTTTTNNDDNIKIKKTTTTYTTVLFNTNLYCHFHFILISVIYTQYTYALMKIKT